MRVGYTMVELVLVEEQVALDQPGKLQSENGSVDCEVVTLTRKGAQVRLTEPLGEAEDLFLAIADFGQIACRVMDADGDYADLRFQADPETQDAVFQEILARLGDDEGRRRFLRRSVLWPGTLHGAEGEMSCTILNMSLGGAKIALSDDHNCAGDVALMGDRFEQLQATVEWQRGRLIGLQFRSEPAEVARVLGDVLPAIKSSA